MEKLTITLIEPVKNSSAKHYIILINNEDYTFANVMKESMLEDERIEFIGYHIPHLLEKKVEFSIITKYDVKKLFKEHSLKIAEYFSKIKI